MIGGSARPAGGPARASDARRLYATVAAIFTLYAVWGSLLPFDFHAVPLSIAVARFWGDAGAVDTAWSLTDLVSNVLLFVPIGLLLRATAATVWPNRPRAVEAGVFAAAVALSASVEFAQAFVTDRTPSVIDVAAEVIGAAAGIALWPIIGAEIDALVAAAARATRRAPNGERLLAIYCAVFALAWLIPADFTLRPAEIGDKYLHKRLLLPLTPSPDAASGAELWATAAAAIPLGAAAVLCGCAAGTRRSVADGLLVTGLSLVALELGQIPVFSRVTDATALLAAIIGGGCGAVAARFTRRRAVASVGGRVLRASALVALWFTVVAVFEWWPFRLTIDPDRAHLIMEQWSQSPFRLPSSALDVVPAAMLAVAGGAFAQRWASPQFPRLWVVAIIAGGAALLIVLQMGRVLFAGGHPTLLSTAIELLALGAGLLARFFAPAGRLHLNPESR